MAKIKKVEPAAEYPPEGEMLPLDTGGNTAAEVTILRLRWR